MRNHRDRPGVFSTSGNSHEAKNRNEENFDELGSGKGNWKQVQGEVQKQWGDLTNDDLDKIEGERTKLEGKLQERYGYAKDQAEKEVDSWLQNRH